MASLKEKYKLEVCVDSYESLLRAREAGADRIELCASLKEGGLTPSYGLLKLASKLDDIPIYVMIRPRAGDFLYSEAEYETMLEDIKIVKKLGFPGIVTGILQADGKIDMERMQDLLRLASPLDASFHRAFDNSLCFAEALEDLVRLGIRRVLTSGGEKTALAGLGNISSWQKRFGRAITIMPGSGITGENIRQICEKSRCSEFHLSAKSLLDSKMDYSGKRNPEDLPIPQERIWSNDIEEIKQVKMILEEYARLSDELDELKD